MNKIFKIFLFIVLAILQLTLMPIFSIKGMIPNLILILAIVLILADFEEDAFYLAAFGGLVLDLAGPFFFGFHTILYIGLIFSIRFLLQKVVEVNLFLVIISVFVFTLIFALLENLFLARLPGLNIIYDGFYSAILGFLAFYLVQNLHRRAQVVD